MPVTTLQVAILRQVFFIEFGDTFHLLTEYGANQSKGWDAKPPVFGRQVQDSGVASDSKPSFI